MKSEPTTTYPASLAGALIAGDHAGLVRTRTALTPPGPSTPEESLVVDDRSGLSPAVVVETIRRLGAPAGTRRLAAVLDELEATGTRGLPVGPAPSAVLANAVLATVDRTLQVAAGAGPIRWVDDVVVPVADLRAARGVRQAFDDALGAIGLEPAVAKCRAVPTGELAAVFGTASLAAGASRGMMRAP